MLTLKNYSVSTEDKTILKNINFTFEKGKVYAIMGPNGSGKSTLALSTCGSPTYTLDAKSQILLGKEDVTHLPPNEKAKKGLFLTLQSPPALSGVTAFQMLRIALQGHVTPVELKEKIFAIAEKLEIKKELLSRSLNDGFSGGERKKFEILQLALLDPTFAFFDEIDTGVDIDALKIITTFLNEFKSKEKTFVFITHYTRILEYIRPDIVLILKDGAIIQTGDYSLAQSIEKTGYESIV